MLTNDIFNGLFELISGFLLLQNCWLLYKAKEVRGVSIKSYVYFATWAFWNMYYYPSLNQWFSFCGGILVAGALTTWVTLAIYYTYFRGKPCW